MRSKLRKFVKILAKQTGDKLTDENIDFYIEQFNKKGEISSIYGRIELTEEKIHVDTSILTPLPIEKAKPVPAVVKKPVVVTPPEKKERRIPKPPVKVEKKERRIPKPPVKVEKKKVVAESMPLFEEMTLPELRLYARKNGIKNMGRTGKMKLMRILKKEYDSKTV